MRLVLGIPLAIGFTALLVMRSPLVGSVVGSSIKQLTGCTLEVTGTTGAYIGLDGRLVLNHFQLRLPGIPGDAGVVLSAEQAVADLDWSGVFTGDVTPTAIRLSKPIFRVSQSMEDGELTIGSLSSRANAPSAAPVKSAPKIDVIDGMIIFGEHAKATGDVHTLKELRVSGGFMPIDAGRPVYLLRFAETGPDREKALLLDGRVNLETGESQIKLFNLALDTWKPESMPTAYRDLWRRMNVQGRIANASMQYTKEQGARAEIVLDGVSMNALIPAEGSASDAMKDLGLENVTGTIGFSRAGLRADLTGKVEGQAGVSSVKLTTLGTDIDAALSCEIIAKRIGLTKETELLPYMPDRARQYFRLFSGPTGELDARVLISRGAPLKGEPAPIQVSGGRISLRHGQAAFHRFTYPFHEMSGEFEFDDNSLHIVHLEGLGPTGATLKADGVITPLTDEAMVDVNVHAQRVPVDQHLLDAMPADRRRVLENVFSRPEYQRLLADGIVRAPGTGEVSAPEFALGGLADIDVNVHTPEGKDAPWFTTIDVHFAEAGMLVDPFPLPIRARDVKLHITDDDAKLVSGTFAPIMGGAMEMSASVLFVENGQKRVRPDVRITAREVPVDNVLLHALPRDEEGPAPAGGGVAGVGGVGETPRDLSLTELMRRLNASGTVGCEAHVTAEPGEQAPGAAPVIAYDIDVDLAGVRCAPKLASEAPTFSIEDFKGKLHVTRKSLAIPGLESHLYRIPPPPGPGEGPFVGPIQCANFALTLEKDLSGTSIATAGRMESTLTVSEANLAAPIERFVGVFSPGAGKALADLRAEHSPTGRVHTTVRLHRAPGENAPMEVGVTLNNASNIEFAALGGRVGVDWPEGILEIVIPASGPQRLRFDHLLARFSLDGTSCGEARLEGSVSLDPVTGSVASPADLAAQFANWNFESPLLPALLQRLTSPATAQNYREFRAVGPFDASIQVSSASEASPPAPGTPLVRVEAELKPRAMAFDWEGERVICDEVSGKVTLRTRAGEGAHAVSGVFDSLAVKTANWDATASGAWYSPAFGPTPGGSRPVQLALTFGLTGRALDGPLRALMPDSAVDAIDALGASFKGPFALRQGIVRTTLGDVPSATTFTGDMEFTDASFAVGVPIDHCTGGVSIRVDAHPAGSKEPTTFEVKAHADALRIVGVYATSAETVVVSGARPGEVLLPSITAQCYGGRLTGHAALQLGEERPLLPDETGPPAPAPPASYSSELVLAGVRLAPVLADAAASGATDPGPVGPPNPFEDPDPSRGVIDARVTLGGVSGDLASRTGSGAIRISNGDIIKLPLMLPLIQVSNLQIPSKDRLGYMQSDFVIKGDTAIFDHVTLLSNSVAIVGAGTLKWPDLILDMKFNSRSNSRVPILSDLIEAMRNEIVSTTVKGKLSAPLVREEPFTGTRKLFDRILHPSAYADALPPIPAVRSPRPQQERARTEGAAEATAMPTQP